MPLIIISYLLWSFIITIAFVDHETTARTSTCPPWTWKSNRDWKAGFKKCDPQLIIKQLLDPNSVLYIYYIYIYICFTSNSYVYPKPATHTVLENWFWERWLSFWRGLFSGSILVTHPKTNMVHLKMGAPWKFGDSYWFHHHFQVPAVNFWGCHLVLGFRYSTLDTPIPPLRHPAPRWKKCQSDSADFSKSSNKRSTSAKDSSRCAKGCSGQEVRINGERIRGL